MFGGWAALAAVRVLGNMRPGAGQWLTVTMHGGLTLAIIGGILWFAVTMARKALHPDVLVISAKGLSFRSVVDGTAWQAPWSRIGEPYIFQMPKSTSLCVTVDGQNRQFTADWGTSLQTLRGMIAAGRDGRIMSAREWQSENPDPNAVSPRVAAAICGAMVVAVIAPMLILHFS